MRSASGGPRVLLRRLRETMAEKVSAQERLDKIVVLIAANMVAEVCSTYVLRVDNTLELYATEGLNRDAVHRTVLSAHEGLVGLVASEATPLNLSDAQSHPAFSFRPETGEEIYHSFLGVPILRAGNTLGVLVVQNRAKRTYVEEEVEALQTTAMVLAEMIASGELAALAQPGAEPAARHSLHKTGAILSDGIALGHVVLHEPRVVINNYIAEDLPKELKRLDTALANLRADLDRMLERGDVAEGGEHRDVLEAYRMFANDQGWSHRLHEAVATGLTAEAAVERVQSDTRARMLRSTDPYLRDRLHELGVDIVGDALDLFAIGLVDGPEGRERVLVLAALQGGLLHLGPFQKTANVEMHEDHADGPRERPGVRVDLVGRDGDVVAARRRHRAERGNHGLPRLPEPPDRAVQFLRGRDRAAGAVDAKHDRTDAGVVTIGTELADLVVDVDDEALQLDDGDALAEEGAAPAP